MKTAVYISSDPVFVPGAIADFFSDGYFFQDGEKVTCKIGLEKCDGGFSPVCITIPAQVTEKGTMIDRKLIYYTSCFWKYYEIKKGA